MLVKKPLVEHFDDISGIHQEIRGYEKCIRVDFAEPLPDDSDEIQVYFEQTAEIVVFGDQAPVHLMCDWRDDQELWLRYNIGPSEPTLEPNRPIEIRRRLLAMTDVEQLRDLDDKDFAEWLEHFEGYPTDTDNITACERECLINNEGDPQAGENFVVYLAGGGPYSFNTEDEAYIFVIANYGSFLHMYNIQ